MIKETSQTIYSTRNVTSFNKCVCGEMFVLRVPTMYYLVDRVRAKRAEADHWTAWMEHLEKHLDESNKEMKEILG